MAGGVINSKALALFLGSVSPSKALARFRLKAVFSLLYRLRRLSGLNDRVFMLG